MRVRGATPEAPQFSTCVISSGHSCVEWERHTGGVATVCPTQWATGGLAHMLDLSWNWLLVLSRLCYINCTETCMVVCIVCIYNALRERKRARRASATRTLERQDVAARSKVAESQSDASRSQVRRWLPRGTGRVGCWRKWGLKFYCCSQR